MAGIDNLVPFKKGDDPRRGSKPKGAKHISTWIQDLLNDEKFEGLLADPKNGWKEYKGAPLKAIIDVMAVKAMQGDVKAFDALAKHGWGQKLQLSNDPENPISTPVDPILANKWTEFLKKNTQDE